MRDLNATEFRRRVGFVAQETQLFATSIEENLAYGLGRKYTREELVTACRRANAHQFISEMEDGFDTRAGEKGVLLSGGQKQRLAIARCFLRKPKV
jgi:ABC-type multidrug transport system fused ATPase/permease subunit